MYTVAALNPRDPHHEAEIIEGLNLYFGLVDGTQTAENQAAWIDEQAESAESSLEIMKLDNAEMVQIREAGTGFLVSSAEWYPARNNRGYGAINAVVTHPDFRRQQFGRRLINAVEERALAADLNMTCLAAVKTAVAFYVELGYVSKGMKSEMPWMTKTIS